MHSLWFSLFDLSFDYKGTEPCFVEPEYNGWQKDFADNVHLIKEELHHYLEKNNLPSYFNTSMVANQNSWKTLSLIAWGIGIFKNQKQFPITTAIFTKYPELQSVSFSMLEPQSSILPHCGDTNAIYRCHLGLEIPAGLPECGMRVREEKKAWENGKWLIFVDAYNHESWNKSNQRRYIMIVDVLRKEFVAKKNKVNATVMTSLFLQRRVGKYSFSKNVSSAPVLFKLIVKCLIPFAQISIWVVNKIKLY